MAAAMVRANRVVGRHGHGRGQLEVSWGCSVFLAVKRRWLAGVGGEVVQQGIGAEFAVCLPGVR